MGNDWLAERFEADRIRLTAVAFRMLGSAAEADDAVQEAWIRLSRTDTSAVQNLSGWLTTVLARVCLNMLQARNSRREEPAGDSLPEGVTAGPAGSDPEHEAVLADSVGAALLVVLDTLAPAERLAFVLHDMFAVPFEEIAPIVDRSPAAARQLACRARRRVQTSSQDDTDADPGRQREIVEAFLAASRQGDFDSLLALLDPDVVARTDPSAVRMGGGQPEVRGADAVAGTFAGRAKGARPALIDGVAGLVWFHRGQLQVVFDFTVHRGKITVIELLADPDLLGDLELELIRS